jgi:glycosyltransferase involved in cell wall biosynthesis
VTISVVVTTKDRAAGLAQALDALERQVGAPPYEICVTDNASTDGTAALLAERATASPVPYRLAYEGVPNRGAARNRSIANATGVLVVFIDDDVLAPPGFLAAHARAHVDGIARAVAGPIVNIADPVVRPVPTAANFSNAFFCTCNVSVPTASLRAVGGFDETFDKYGWEDTELGVRLRESGVARGFAWDAFVHHLKPPHADTLAVALRRTIEKARMAGRFVRKHPSTRVRLATGAYAANRLRGKLLAPKPLLPFFAGIATMQTLPGAVRAFARGRLLDGVYLDELARALGEP